ncbi:Essential MCU regulator, mitochondrial [Holothuria leucospilota]|uniref:Essential MCU regulator, mitochondrial n=1 Tax=Holothuria leucospilota TaxID=206669 RepID=A0A9Q1H936_HOLLE|nr:Essential MCU regulator, mitochondrial [Holothuria leucospilota]
MAISRVWSVPIFRLQRRIFGPEANSKRLIQQHCVRWKTTTSYGGIQEMPTQTRFGLIKTIFVSVPFLYFGATISKEGAAFLEENDIFVPEDDDD